MIECGIQLKKIVVLCKSRARTRHFNTMFALCGTILDDGGGSCRYGDYYYYEILFIFIRSMK